MRATLLPILILIISLSSLLPSSPPRTAEAQAAPPPPSSAPTTRCPIINTLELNACVDVLSGLVHLGIGGDATQACCPVISGLAGLDAALCLCTAIRAKLLGINIMLPVAMDLLADCGKHAPSGYRCPSS